MKTQLPLPRLTAALGLLLAGATLLTPSARASEGTVIAKPGGAPIATELPLEVAVLTKAPNVPPPIGRKHPAKVRKALIHAAAHTNRKGLDQPSRYLLEAAQLLERDRGFAENDHPNAQSEAIQAALLAARAEG